MKKITKTSGRVKEELMGYTDIKVKGAVTFQNNCESKQLIVVGRGKFQTLVKTAQLNNHGVSSFNTLEAGKIINIGALTLKEGEASEVFSNGYLSVQQEIRAKKIVSEGIVKANSLQAEHIELSITGYTNIQTLQASYIKINVKNRILSFSKKQLNCEAILGNRIYLHSTTVKYIKGAHVQIGPNCYVDELVYSESYSIDPTSTLIKAIKEQGNDEI